MTIYTSFYKNSQLTEFYPEDLVAISVGVPENWQGTRARIFEPKWELVDNYRKGIITWAKFTELYEEKMGKLTNEQILAELEDYKVYLCHESKSNCHRHIFAHIMRERFNIDVIEL